jgi:hypothetical protein
MMAVLVKIHVSSVDKKYGQSNATGIDDGMTMPAVSCFIGDFASGADTSSSIMKFAEWS